MRGFERILAAGRPEPQLAIISSLFFRRTTVRMGPLLHDGISHSPRSADGLVAGGMVFGLSGL